MYLLQRKYAVFSLSFFELHRFVDYSRKVPKEKLANKAQFPADVVAFKILIRLLVAHVNYSDPIIPSSVVVLVRFMR